MLIYQHTDIYNESPLYTNYKRLIDNIAYTLYSLSPSSFFPLLYVQVFHSRLLLKIVCAFDCGCMYVMRHKIGGYMAYVIELVRLLNRPDKGGRRG